MKPLAQLVSLVLHTGLILGGSVLVVTSGNGADGLDLLAITGLVVIFYCPHVLLNLFGRWNVRVSRESRRAFAAWFAAVLAAQLLGGVALVVHAVSAATPAWIPTVIIGVAGALSVLAVRVGQRISRRPAPSGSPSHEWALISRVEVERSIRVIVLTFGLCLIVGAVLIAVLIATIGSDDPRSVVEVALYVASLAFLAAGLATLVVTRAWNRRLRMLMAGDLGTGRRLAQAVLGGRSTTLSDAERPLVARYASTLAGILPFQLTWIGSLYVGVALIQVEQAWAGSTFATTVLAGMVVALLLVTLLTVRRIRRARRFVRENTPLLQESTV